MKFGVYLFIISVHITAASVIPVFPAKQATIYLLVPFNFPILYIVVSVSSANSLSNSNSFSTSLYSSNSAVKTAYLNSMVQAYVAQNVIRKKVADDNRRISEGSTLQDVKVTALRMTPERKMVTEKYGKPTLIIDGEAIQAKEEKWSYGLYSVLIFSFPDKVRVERSEEGDLRLSLFNGEPTLIVIDGEPVLGRDYPLIPNIPPSEVTSFEIIEYASDFMTLYCQVYPGACSISPPTIGNVIAIYTPARQGLFGANRAEGILKAAVPGFSTTRTFSAPVHANLQPGDWLKPDLRSLLYWQPNAITDSAGMATCSFYTADITSRVV
jgi:hypothetical protein